MEKMTYVKALTVAMNGMADGEAKDKLMALKASLEKKASAKSDKPTKTQIANDKFKADIMEFFEANAPKMFTVTDLIKSVGSLSEMSNQKVSALVRQLKDENVLRREEIKGKAYFSLVE